MGYLLGECLEWMDNGAKRSKPFMMKAVTQELCRRMVKFLGDISGRECTGMWRIIAKPVMNVSGGLE